MSALTLALLVGILFATGTYMILRRGQIKLILGLALLGHGVNLLLFNAGVLTRGQPPVILNKKAYAEIIASSNFADPLPQALILTAVVISFGITAFIVVLVDRRDALTGSDVVPGELARYISASDPFASTTTMHDELQRDAAEDYDLLRHELDEVYDQRRLAHAAHGMDETQHQSEQ